jgi:Zn-dependent peptidase ImmA (M78 family)/transcriptional regulator with XRE-family HTH domain
VNSINLNPDMVKVARQAKGYSQAELATRSGLSQSAVSKLEAGLVPQPAEDVPAKLAGALDVPAAFLMQQERVYGLPVSVHYRKKASVGQRLVEQLEADVNMRLLQLRRLLQGIELQPELSLPFLDIDEYNGDAAAIAALVRRTWLVPSGPIRNLVDYVERAGIIVVPSDFQAVGVDGLTLRVPGLPICIFLNQNMPGDRQRFTLAHELGHAVMHRLPTPEMEKEADSFASALLMPELDIRSSLYGGLSLQKLALLKPVWRVSMGALLYRARTTGAITDSQSHYLWRQMSAAGYRRQEPAELDVPVEEPKVLSGVVQAHIQELGYSMEELALLMHVNDEYLKERYGLVAPRPGLRLVK